MESPQRKNGKVLTKQETGSQKKTPNYSQWKQYSGQQQNDHAQVSLPFFQEKVLYPPYEKSLTQYKHESKILTEYMKEVYQYKDYEVDAKGLIKFPLQDRWLRGEEYGFLLRHYKTYQALGGCRVHYKG